MEPETVREAVHFSAREQEIIAGYDLPAEAFIPLLLSLRTGGDWSYASETVRAISILDRTTRYDERNGTGITKEEIYLVVNPEIVEKEGRVLRLEKCGEEVVRLRVERPYRVVVKGDRMFVARVDPEALTIQLAELDNRTLHFTGSPAYGVDHEIEHMEKKTIGGIPLYRFEYRTAE